MKSTFKILFYLKKNEPKKNGHVVIMVRITVDGDQVQFSSKLDVHPDNWDTKLGRAVVNKQSAEKKENLRVSSLNKTLDEIRAAITMHYTRMMNTDGYALPEKIRNAFLGLEEKDKTLISYFTQHNEQYAKKVGKTATQKTYSRYELTKQRMIEFLKSEYNIYLYADRRRHPNRGGRQEVDYERQRKDRSGIAYSLAAYPVGNTCQIRRQDKKRQRMAH